MSYDLQIRLFGKPDFHLQNSPDPQISSRKAAALLVFLATSRKEHSRESLAEMFWEGRSQTQSMANLRVLLTRLRQSMGDYLTITWESVSFNQTTESWIDIEQFENHLASAARMEAEFGSDSPDANEELIQAIELSKADFLEGFYVRNCPAFDAWVRIERERLRRMSLQGLSKLTAWFQARHEYERGIQFAQQWLDLDPLSESAHRELMRVYALNGQRSTALRQYETCKQVLMAELKVEPSTSTQTLYEKIRKGNVGELQTFTDSDEIPDKAIRGYHLGRLIGRGPFGAVYQAYQVHTDRDVAVKVILPRYANHPDFIRRFDLEARRISRLEHLHIVPLYDFWREPSSAKLVMRLMRGGNLEERLIDGPLNPTDASLLVNQISDALSAAHQQGLLHGNIKPTNILFGESGNAYLSDFGITKIVLPNPPSAEVTQSPYDPYYLAPEQIRTEPISLETDIYNLGVIIFEILTGFHPFAQAQPTEMLDRQLHDPLPSLNSYNPGLPTALDVVIQRACAKLSADRYHDV
jgi:DNA-binding SARP family transcriptional activator